MKVKVVNLGLGNLGSVVNALNKVGAEPSIVERPEELEGAERILLPGVGAFDVAMGRLRERGFEPVLNQQVRVDKTPILGICLGMQLLAEFSDEGVLPGLGWITGRSVHFHEAIVSSSELRVPHMGWNTVAASPGSLLFSGQSPDARYYFMHSYHLSGVPGDMIAGETKYGVKFTCAIESENVYGAQFHPEKSHQFGIEVLRNFTSRTHKCVRE